MSKKNIGATLALYLYPVIFEFPTYEYFVTGKKSATA